MSRAYLSLLLISGLSAQTANNAFEKAPPATDAALRERITKFYQAQTDKKYRQAEQFVSEDSMDTFLGLNKASCVSFKIGKIIYSDNFTKAQSTVLCSQFLPFPGFEKPVDVPMPDNWKVEDGKWFWSMDLSQGRETPFGHADLTNRPPGGGGAPAPAMVTLDSINKGVQADKTVVMLNSKYSSDDVVKVANILPGPVTLHLEGVVPKGVRVTLEQKELNGGEQTRILFHSEPAEDRKPLEVRVLVSPVNIVIPIQVTFQ